MTALRGKTNVDQLHAVGFGGEFFPIGFELRIARHLVIVANVESQGLLGSRDFGGLCKQGTGGKKEKKRSVHNSIYVTRFRDLIHTWKRESCWSWWRKPTGR